MELKRGNLKVILFNKEEIENYIKAGWKKVEEPIRKKPKKSNKKVEVIENKDSEPIE